MQPRKHEGTKTCTKKRREGFRSLHRPTCAFDKELRSPALDHHEVDFSTVRVAEVPELEITTLGVLLEVDPFEEVPRHEALESE